MYVCRSSAASLNGYWEKVGLMLKAIVHWTLDASISMYIPSGGYGLVTHHFKITVNEVKAQVHINALHPVHLHTYASRLQYN